MNHRGTRRPPPRRLLQRLELDERLLVEVVQRLRRRLDRGLGGGEVGGALRLERRHLVLHRRHLLLLDGAERRLLVGDGRLLAHLHEQLVGLRLLLLDDDHLVLQLHLHLGDLRRRRAQLDEALLEAHLHLHVDLGLLDEQLLVQRDQLQERLGRRVHLPPLRREVLRAHRAHRLVDERHVVRDVLAHLVGVLVHLRVLEEALRHRDERLARPRVEPVDRRAVGERGELAAADAERVAHRREAEDDVEVQRTFSMKYSQQLSRESISPACFTSGRIVLMMLSLSSPLYSSGM